MCGACFVALYCVFEEEGGWQEWHSSMPFSAVPLIINLHEVAQSINYSDLSWLQQRSPISRT